MDGAAAGGLFGFWAFLTRTHDAGYLLGAGAVCVVALAIGFRNLRQWLDGSGSRRAFRLILGVVSLGGGVWSAHFIAMLGWRPDLALGFEAWGTVATAALAFAAIGPAFFLGAARRSALGDALGGTAAAAATAAVHGLSVARLGGCVAAQDLRALAVFSLLGAVGGALALVALRRAPRRRAALATLAFSASVAAIHLGALATTRAEPGGPRGLSDLSRLAVEPVMATLAAALTLGLAAVALAHDRGEAERDRLVAVATHTQNGVLLVDPAGRVAWANPAFSGLTGRSLRALKGRTVLAALGVAGAAEGALAEALTSGRPREMEIALDGPNGAPLWSQLTIVPIGDAARGRRDAVIVLNDVTDLKAREADLAAALRRAEEASRAKSEFISVMSHELRTPLNGVLGMASLIGLGPLSERQRAQLATLRESGERLSRVLSDILEFAADAADAAPRAPVSPADLLDDVAAIVAGDAAAKGLRFSARLGDDLPETVATDRETLGRLLLRLADNAVKFTESGEVEIALGTDPQRPGALVCTVRDSGPGLPAGAAERIFEVFSQADSSATRPVGGLGLGLALCRRGAQRLGGRIEAESAPGRGATFRVVIPGAVDPAAARPLSRRALTA